MSRIKTASPEQKSRWNLATRYGLTPAQVSEILTSQKNRCAVCRGSLARATVDHCHRTGRVRGILCHGCNIKLPALENGEFLAAALAYLKQS